MTRGPADVARMRWRGRQMLQQLMVQHIGAHSPLHRGISLIGKLVSQTGPGVIAHQTALLDSPPDDELRDDRSPDPILCRPKPSIGRGIKISSGRPRDGTSWPDG